jgi:signal transduction histidine kinase/DNA-binding response OmpR family regulator
VLTAFPAPGDGAADTTFLGGGEMGALTRATNWSLTPLGPSNAWPQSLKTSVSICLASRFPILIWWGRDLVMLYNDGYRPMLGAKHPHALGTPGHEVWAEIWNIIGPMLEGVMTRGEATWSDDQMLPLHRNGFSEECYFTFTYSPIREETGGVGGVFCAVIETTARVLGERRMATLRELAARATVASSAEDACRTAAEVLGANNADVPFALLYLLDEHGTQLTLGGATGLPSGTLASPHAVDLASDSASVAWPFEAIARGASAVEIDDVGQRFGQLAGDAWPEPPHTALLLPIAQAGQQRPYGVLVAGVSPRLAFDDGYRGYFDLVAGHVATAIANSRAHEAERKRAVALAEIDRVKTAFFTNVSHEFRTPLTLLLGPLEDTLGRKDLEPRVRDDLASAHRNSLRLLKLVNTLLDFSRIEAGRMQTSFEPTDLSAFTSELASGFRSAIEKAGLRLVISAPQLPEPVFVDREMWEKIVLNLLSNAFKHTFEGEITVCVRATESGDAELVVRDSGIGIAATELPHLFERFRRVPDARSRTHEGTGIGLALVQDLVQLHGGHVTVESQEGIGTAFTVRIPLGASHLDPARIGGKRGLASTAIDASAFTDQAFRWLPEVALDEPNESDEVIDSARESPNDGATSATARTDPGCARILLADDNADMREYAGRLLRSRGWTVESVADGQAALEAVTRDRPDIVLTDVMMPRLDGFGLLQALREDPATRDVPVILLSARAGEESRVEGLDAGADDYLVKPFSARELLARVGAHLNLARVRAAALAQVEAARAELQSVNAQLREQAAALELQAVELRATTDDLIERTHEAERQRRLVAAIETRLRSTFTQAPVAIAVVRGPQHHYEIANEVYLQLVGHRSLIGLPIRKALPELEGQGVYELLDNVIDTGKPFVGNELRVMLDHTGSGSVAERFFNFVYQPLLDVGGRVDGVAVVATDVTDLVLSRRAAVQAQAAAEEANRVKSEFLAAMSHELRTPLNAISGHVQLIEMEIHGPVTPAQREALARVQRSEQHLLSLVNDVLNFAKLEAGRVEYNIDDIALADAVARVTPMIEPQLAAKQLLYRTSLGEGISVSADTDKVEQILLNLLSNAVKFTEPSGSICVETGMVERDAGLPQIHAYVSVTDTGVGIPSGKLEVIFDPFVQVHHGHARLTEGTGLGLAISRDLAQGMGGDLSVRSTPGAGSTFTLTLPLHTGTGGHASAVSK